MKKPTPSQPTTKSEPIDEARLSAGLRRRIDAWIAAHPEPRPTRPEAIRRLLAEALGTPAAKAKEPTLPPPPSDAYLRALEMSETKLKARKRQPQRMGGRRRRDVHDGLSDALPSVVRAEAPPTTDPTRPTLGDHSAKGSVPAQRGVRVALCCRQN
jgi:hypothetical protein